MAGLRGSRSGIRKLTGRLSDRAEEPPAESTAASFSLDQGTQSDGAEGFGGRVFDQRGRVSVPSRRTVDGRALEVTPPSPCPTMLQSAERNRGPDPRQPVHAFRVPMQSRTVIRLSPNGHPRKNLSLT